MAPKAPPGSERPWSACFPALTAWASSAARRAGLSGPSPSTACRRTGCVVYEHLKTLKGNRRIDTTTVAKTVKLPTTTAHRALEELVVYGLAERIPQGRGRPDLWRAV